MANEIIMENNRSTLLKLVDKRSSEIKDLDIKLKKDRNKIPSLSHD